MMGFEQFLKNSNFGAGAPGCTGKIFFGEHVRNENLFRKSHQICMGKWSNRTPILICVPFSRLRGDRFHAFLTFSIGKEAKIEGQFKF